MRLNHTSHLLLGLVTLVAASQQRLAAGTNGFVVPLIRGAAGSQAGYWETFKVASGTPGNTPDQPGATTQAILYQTDTNAFLTGSGNIYNLETSAFVLSDAPPSVVGTVILQARTVGTELDYRSVSLTYTNESGPSAISPLFRYELDRTSGQGANVSSLWQWDLTGLGITNYTVSMIASGPSLSFDSLTLDTAGQFAPSFAEQPFRLQTRAANIARWMYPFNANPAARPTASVFGALGSNPDFDSRDAQFLLGWFTTNQVPAGHGAENYLIRRARVTLTISGGNQYVYSGTLRDFRSYFPTNDARYIADARPGSPVELFGVGFRGSLTNSSGVVIPYSATNYPQDGPWAVDPNGGFHTNRVAYAAGFDLNGSLVDVSNNVADNGTNEVEHPFEVAPFAVGQSTNVAEGGLMPAGAKLSFDLNLDDPLIYKYVQEALNQGVLSLMASSFQGASLTGAPTYPSFYTSFSPIAEADEHPLLDIEGEVVRANVDRDADGLSDDWENFYLGGLAGAGSDDPDNDRGTNLSESAAGTNPGSGASVFKLLSITQNGAGAELQFTPSLRGNPQIRWSDDLRQWQTVTNPAVVFTSDWLSKTRINSAYPSPTFTVWKDTNSPAAQRFYQVEGR